MAWGEKLGKWPGPEIMHLAEQKDVWANNSLSPIYKTDKSERYRQNITDGSFLLCKHYLALAYLPIFLFLFSQV